MKDSVKISASHCVTEVWSHCSYYTRQDVISNWVGLTIVPQSNSEPSWLELPYSFVLPLHSS